MYPIISCLGLQTQMQQVSSRCHERAQWAIWDLWQTEEYMSYLKGATAYDLRT